MLSKQLLSIVAACCLSLSGVFAIEQKQAALALQQLRQEAAAQWATQERLGANLETFENAYQAQNVITRMYNVSWREPNEDENFVAISLYAEPGFEGSHCSINWEHLRENRCVDLPPQAKAKSVTKSPGAACCLLYRSPCPPVARAEGYFQSPGFFHQRIFSNSIADLTPYGFTEHPRSVMCPSKDICDGFQLDRNWSPRTEISLSPWWVDYRYIPERRHI